MSKVYLILGSNVGNKNQIIEDALHDLEILVGSIIQKSSVYSTEPWGMESNEYFLNRVVVLESDLLPMDILDHCLKIETKYGRIRKNSSLYENRTLDIDILFIDQLVINEKNLQIPHPRISERRFVLEPLAEICSDFVHPQLHKTIALLFKESNDNSNVDRVL